MTTYILDASAILRFTDKEAGFDRVRDLFIQAARGNVELLLSAVNWGEIVGALYKRAGGLSASALPNIGSLAANLAALPLTVVPEDQDHAEGAAIFKYNFKVPFVDAFAGSLALHQNATLVTADYDFKSVPSGTIEIEFLPTK
jgi:predicted nucleic acid-binding protein